jgi:hypothetical protein
MITDHDTRERHCPMLGHEIAFTYCRSPGQTTPCRKIFDCWFDTFDIQAFIADNFDADSIMAITMPPKPKIATLFDIIRQAQERNRPPSTPAS